MIEEVEQTPETYFKHLEGTDGIYEIRVQAGKEIFRIFAFFDKGNLIVIGHGFQKKTQKLPKAQIEKAEEIKNDQTGTNG